MIRLVVFVVLLALGMNAPVHAASFDCGKAATPFEKAICGDPELSAADERLARTYATAIGGLSEGALGPCGQTSGPGSTLRSAPARGTRSR